MKTLFAAYIVCIGLGFLAVGHIYANTPVQPYLEYVNQTSFQVVIYETSTHEKRLGAGSATHLYKNIFLTARHVCDEATPGMIELVQYDKKVFQVIESILTDSASNDLCLLKTEEASTMPSVPVATLDKFSALGERVFIGGYSGGRFYSVRTGYVYLEAMIEVMDKAGAIPMRVQFLTVFGEPGISGAGVLNIDKELVGVAVAVGPQGLAIVPLAPVRKFLNAHKVLQP